MQKYNIYYSIIAFYLGLKCNVDASIFKEEGCYAIDMCFRWDRWEYIRQRQLSLRPLTIQRSENKRFKRNDKLIWQFEIFFGVYQT